ncbi:MAG: three-Cys-motif partner protein TcmP [Candidatus Helarchaeota archaeon]|nr:three-Cys-motif partner protein TcmP [Candidatus Helarchaeota archaeon]
MNENKVYHGFGEHTKSKLKLLESYIPQWDYIVGRRRPKHFIIDCMAGTGYNKIENQIVKGSALIACKRLQYKRNLEIILIERDRKNFETLQKSVKEYLKGKNLIDELEKIEFHCRDCNKIIDSVLNDIRGNISLFVIDSFSAPFNELIEKIGSRTLNPRPFRMGTEIFIFFNAPYLNQYGKACVNYKYEDLIKKAHLSEEEVGAKKKIEEFNRIFGDESWQIIFKNYSKSKDRIVHLLKLYINKLKRFFRFAVPLSVKDYKGKLKYFFIFVTNHYEAFYMVYKKRNQIEIEGTLIQYCNLGREFNPQANARRILLKNLKKRISKDERLLLSKMLRYKVDFETDFFDENLERFFETLLKNRLEKQSGKASLKPGQKTLSPLKKKVVKVSRTNALDYLQNLLNQLHEKKILKKEKHINGIDEPFNRYYINPRFLKPPQTQLTNFK